MTSNAHDADLARLSRLARAEPDPAFTAAARARYEAALVRKQRVRHVHAASALSGGRADLVGVSAAAAFYVVAVIRMALAVYAPGG